MKKIVIFGGGSGLSQVLKGLKLFPIDITAVVSVADNGQSTGRLRKEMHQPAVGDITKVMLSMSQASDDIKNLMNYRFTKIKSIGNHSVKNLLLTALLDQKKDFSSSLPVLEDLLDIKHGQVIPLMEDDAQLMGITKNGKKIIGEEQITKSKSKIVKIMYDKKVVINKDVLRAVNEADLIIFSCGSLYTSVIPHIVIPELVNKIKHCKAKVMYLCNLFTQPGETDNFKVSDHINKLEEYLGKHSIDIVIANDKEIDSEIAQKYLTNEQKNPVIFDKENLEKMKIKIIADKIFTLEDNVYRHDALKVAYLIFSYLMEE